MLKSIPVPFSALMRMWFGSRWTFRPAYPCLRLSACPMPPFRNRGSGFAARSKTLGWTSRCGGSRSISPRQISRSRDRPSTCRLRSVSLLRPGKCAAKPLPEVCLSGNWHSTGPSAQFPGSSPWRSRPGWTSGLSSSSPPPTPLKRRLSAM